MTTTTTRIPRGRKLKQQFSYMYLRLQITIPLTVDFLPFPPPFKGKNLFGQNLTDFPS